eukprot:s1232_g1.t1
MSHSLILQARAPPTRPAQAEVGEDIRLFQQMLPHLRFLLDFMEHSGFKDLRASSSTSSSSSSTSEEPEKLSEAELQLLQGIASMFAEAKCDLEDKKIGDAGAKVVAEAVKHTATQWLNRLNLRRNEIGDDGGQALGDGLKSNGSLQKLVLEDNSIGAAGAEAPGPGGAAVEPRGGVPALADGLKSNGSLKDLWLAENSIGDAGELLLLLQNLAESVALADGLKSNGSLEFLGLGRNSIGAAGAEALADGLKSNGSLKELYLGGNSIGDAGAQAPC